MNVGKIPENVLKRAVLGHIDNKREEILIGAGVGEDCAVLCLKEGEVYVTSTDPITGTAKDIGKLAVLVTANDLASSGAEPVGILISALLPDGFTEPELREIMVQVNEQCTKHNIQLMGGHTEITRAVNQPILTVTGVGKIQKDKLITTGGAKPDQDIVVSKYIALEGTSIIAKEKEDELLTRYPKEMIKRAQGYDEYISVVNEGRIAAEVGVSAMHDVTEGGIFGALWEVAAGSGVGLTVDLKAIPIKQETVEICNYFNINPYELISSGSMLIVAPDGEKLVASLSESGIPATIIGRTNNSNDKIIQNGEETRYLEPPKTDELYKVI
jgi:hydrogenase maturation factor